MNSPREFLKPFMLKPRLIFKVTILVTFRMNSHDNKEVQNRHIAVSKTFLSMHSGRYYIKGKRYSLSYGSGSSDKKKIFCPVQFKNPRKSK